MTLRIATALTDAGRESAVVQVVSTMADAVVVRRCRDVVELRAVAHSAQVDAVVVDSGLRGLDRDVVVGLMAAGVRCIIVGEHQGVGAAATVPTDLSDLPDVLRSPADLHALPTRDDASDMLELVHGTGRVVVVWGPMGAPGRTTVAIELAACLSGSDADVLLVDLDTTGPSVAQLLGLLDDTSGVAAAARLGAEGQLTAAQLAGAAVALPTGPRVLVGLSSPERWTELRPAATDAVLAGARVVAPWTVVDIGPGIEGDDLAWLDADVPQRFGAARAALAAADVVVCVGRSDPVGLTRLLKEVPQIRSLAPTAAIEIILNRVPSGSRARHAGELVTDLLDISPLQIPEDAQTVQRAQLAGQPIRVQSPNAPFTRSIELLATRLDGLFGSYDRRHEQTRRPDRRLLRRPHRRHRHRDAGLV